ncbi:MAG: VOC family protein [bacterium]|jgi:uncharacterized glyoxalase superfamily protein PhnB
MIQQGMYVLAVQDLEASARYYQDILGFSVHEIGDPGWRMLRKDGCRIMIGHCPETPAARELGDHSYFAYWIVDDIEAYFERVQQRGAELIKHLRSEPWGMREFGLRTPDGHRIMIGQSEEASP